MKKVVIIALVAVFGMFGAQAQKIGHISVADLVAAMPEAQNADKELNSQYELKSADIKKAADALQAKGQAFQEKISKMTEADIQTQATSLQAEQQALQAEAAKIDELRQKAQEDMQKKEQDLLTPIRKKAMDAIEAVAKAKGLEYVIDSSTGVLVIANGPDIINDVKAKLGIQ